MGKETNAQTSRYTYKGSSGVFSKGLVFTRPTTTGLSKYFIRDLTGLNKIRLILTNSVKIKQK